MDITTRTKIDAIWQGMWDNGMADAKTNITQITYLLFIKMLDDAQIKKEANANAFGVKVKNPTFPEGRFAEDKGEDGNTIEIITYEDLRWHNFVHFSTEKMYHIVKVVGLDKKAIDEKCAKFLNINDFNKEQRQLINLIIDFAIRNGNVTKDDLVNTEPFSDIEIPELFDNELAPILQLVAMFTNPLNVAA